LTDLQAQAATLEQNRISLATSVGELNQRFPHFAREIEQEIKNYEFSK
jgi:hypothetical protein